MYSKEEYTDAPRQRNNEDRSANVIDDFVAVIGAPLSRPVQRHLARVYRNLASATGVAVVSYAATPYLPTMISSIAAPLLGLIALVVAFCASARRTRLTALGVSAGSIGILSAVNLDAMFGPFAGQVAGRSFLLTFATVLIAAIGAMRSTRLVLTWAGGIVFAISMFFFMTLFFPMPAESLLFVISAAAYLFFDSALIVARANRALTSGAQVDDVSDTFVLFNDAASLFLKFAAQQANNKNKGGRNNGHQSRSPSPRARHF